MNYRNIYDIAANLSESLFPYYVNSLREEAFNKIKNSGFPNLKQEKYKYSPLADIFEGEYVPVNPYEWKRYPESDFSEIEAIKIYTVNGVCVNNEIKSESGFIYGSLVLASREYEEIVEKYYNRLVDNTDLPSAMNIATALSGAFVNVNPGVETTRPLMIINIIDSEARIFSQQHNLFVFGENSVAEVIEYNIDISNVPTLANNLSETVIERNAQVNIVRVQDKGLLSRHISSDYSRQYEGSSFDCSNIVLGGGLVRQNTEVHLLEKHCCSNLYGLVVAGDKQHVDNYTFIDHAVPECQSNELYKSILNDKAVNVFNGRILVRPDAQKTLAFQSNRNILLNTGAKVYTKPQLEIYADDVKCSHGATVGQLNEDALFYMQSRGISKPAAQMLLMSGFANEILEKIKNPEFYDFILSIAQTRNSAVCGDFMR
ncbi:MAG: Fe-S cluster assembly protein SufD [Prevotellaceae bacterium]|jgi:Fe-S cluster assembly protein SufD|nr:Fe-S cluster assembly protein SufD [Prevotellaceae bacterium]